jgi:LuxR family transcriptional regulator, maltose regulon positive regulatory protein
MMTLAKLTRPRLHSALMRDRLFARLSECTTRPVVWIQAPPGGGKTSLVASFLDAHRGPGLWFQVDAADSDVPTFFYYLTVAARTLLPQVALRLPTSEYLSDLAAYARLYFRGLFGSLERGSTLVIDDHHELRPDSRLHELLAIGWAEIPQGVNVLIASRGDIPPHYARLASLDRIARLDWHDLKLSLSEARAIVAMRCDLDDEVVRRLHERSGGWVTGLTLTVERLKQLRIADDDATALPLESVFNFFASQIFSVASPETRDFLLKTALLPRQTAAMAEAMSGSPRAESLLDWLYRRGLFTERRDAMYQYHDLFRAFLLEELRRAHPPGALAELRVRAARLLEIAGDVDEAANLYARAEDWTALSRMVCDRARSLIAKGRTETVRAWIRVLPADRTAGDPWMSYWLGSTWLHGAPSEARRCFARAYALFDARRSTAGRTLACAGVLFSFWLEFADFQPMDPWVERLVSLDGAEPGELSPEWELHVATALLFGVAFRRPERALWQMASARVEALLARDIPVGERLAAASILLLCLRGVGEMERGDRLARAMRPLVDLAEVSPMHRCMWWLQVGWHEWFAGNVAVARRAFALVETLREEAGLPLPMLHVYPAIGLSCCALDGLDLARAEAECQRALAPWDASRVLDTVFVARMRSQIAAHRGDWTAALRYAEQSVTGASRASRWWEFNNRILLAYLLTRADRLEDARRELRQARALVAGTSHDTCVCEVDLVEAYLLCRTGEVERGRRALRSALQRAAGEGFHCNSRTLPDLYATMLGEALVSGIEPGFAAGSIRRLGVRPPEAAPEEWPWPVRVRSLGCFSVACDEKLLSFERKTPRKPLQLLKALIAAGGQAVPEHRLIDALWSDEDGDLAHNAFSVALARLRKLLGHPAAIVQSGGCLSLDPTLVWVDALRFRQLIDGALALGRAAERPSLERMLRLYDGAFLPEEGEAGWAIVMREQLRHRYTEGLLLLGRRQRDAGSVESAIATY